MKGSSDEGTSLPSLSRFQPGMDQLHFLQPWCLSVCPVTPPFFATFNGYSSVCSFFCFCPFLFPLTHFLLCFPLLCSILKLLICFSYKQFKLSDSLFLWPPLIDVTFTKKKLMSELFPRVGHYSFNLISLPVTTICCSLLPYWSLLSVQYPHLHTFRPKRWRIKINCKKKKKIQILNSFESLHLITKLLKWSSRSKLALKSKRRIVARPFLVRYELELSDNY